MNHRDKFTRRELLKLSAAVLTGDVGALVLSGCNSLTSSGTTPPSSTVACSKLTDIQHVVILIQENRSFDHYFGSYPRRSGIFRPRRVTPAT